MKPMTHEEFMEILKQDPEYIKAEQGMRPLLDIATAVLRERVERGWSLEELSRRSGLSVHILKQIEGGFEIRGGFNTYNRLAVAFGLKWRVSLAPLADDQEA